MKSKQQIVVELRQQHELADIFPMLDEPELAGLAADIEANGLRQPITLYQDQILDGRNRFTACRRAGVEPIFETYDGDDPLGYALHNTKRTR
jgi:ParB-like chromosome segregation protein Spo0J